MENNSQTFVFQRFKECVEKLVEDGIASSKIQIGRSMHLTSSKTNELLGGRNRLYAHHVYDFLNAWPINALYMFGFSDEIYTNTPAVQRDVEHDLVSKKTHTHVPSEQNVHPKHEKNVHAAVHPTPVLEQLLNEKDRVITTQAGTINALEKTIALLMEKCAEK